MCHTKYGTFGLRLVGEGKNEERKDDDDGKTEKEFEKIRCEEFIHDYCGRFAISSPIASISWTFFNSRAISSAFVNSARAPA